MLDISNEDWKALGGALFLIVWGGITHIREKMKDPAPVSMALTDDMKHDLDKVEEAANQLGQHVDTLSGQVKFILAHIDSAQTVVDRVGTVEDTQQKILVGLDQILRRVRQVGHRVNNVSMKMDYVIQVSPGVDKKILEIIENSSTLQAQQEMEEDRK